LELAALHQGRVKVKIVWHHCGTDDADRHICYSHLPEAWSDQRLAHLQETRRRLLEDEDFYEVADANGHN